MKIFNFLRKKQSTQKSTRRCVKDVEPGQIIYIEWYKISGNIGQVKCINNDPETKKILIEVTWSNYKEINCNEKERAVIEYSDSRLKNFHLLNEITMPKNNSDSDSYIAILQKEMNEALKKEDYEIADELQKKINKILKK
jgi:hypothetical protein